MAANVVQAQQELAAAQAAAREQAAGLAAANANLAALRGRCERLEAELAQHAHPRPGHDVPGEAGCRVVWSSAWLGCDAC